MEKNEHVSAFPTGSLNESYAKYFIGNSYTAALTGNDCQVNITNVTFEPGCRNNWHVHHGCQQILVCVGGKGWYQEEGKEPVALKPGDVVEIPLDTKHWHGAQKDCWFSHLSIMSCAEMKNASTAWLEPVSDEYYNQLK